MFLFQQDNAPTHHTHDMVEFLSFCAMRHPIY